MKEYLKLILRLTQTFGITIGQAMILLGKKYQIMIPVSTLDSTELNKKGLLKGSKLDDVTSARITELEKAGGKKSLKQGVKRPYKFVYEHIKEKIIPNTISPSIRGSIDKFFPQEGETKDYFLAFIYLFPSSSMDQNSKWTSHFGVQYRGNKLRVVSQKAVKEFSSICRQYDPDILLLAVYNMIIDSVKVEQNQAFIMKITNFLVEWYERYLEAQTMLEKHGDQIFTKTDRSISTIGNKILL